MAGDERGEGTIEVGDEGRSGLSRMQFRRSPTYGKPNGPVCAQTIWSKYAQTKTHVTLRRDPGHQPEASEHTAG